MTTLAFLKWTSHGDGGSHIHESSGSGSVDVSTVRSPSSTKPDSPGWKWKFRAIFEIKFFYRTLFALSWGLERGIDRLKYILRKTGIDIFSWILEQTGGTSTRGLRKNHCEFFCIFLQQICYKTFFCLLTKKIIKVTNTIAHFPPINKFLSKCSTEIFLQNTYCTAQRPLYDDFFQIIR